MCLQSSGAQPFKYLPMKTKEDSGRTIKGHQIHRGHYGAKKHQNTLKIFQGAPEWLSFHCPLKAPWGVELSAALLPVPGTHSHPTSLLSTLYLCSNSVQNSSVQNSLLCPTVFYFILLFITYYFIVCSFCLFYGIYSILVKCP